MDKKFHIKNHKKQKPGRIFVAGIAIFGLLLVSLFVAVFSPTPLAFAASTSLQLSLSKQAISVVIPQGGMAQVATLTSNGARQFAFANDPTTSRYRIRWTEIAGPINPGQSIPLHILVDSTVPIGDYTGVATLTNPANNAKLQIQVEVHVVSSAFHFSLTPSFISVTIPQGGTKQVMIVSNLSSKSTNSVSFDGSPISSQTGIKWLPNLPAISIGAPYGIAIPSIYVSTTVPVGSYSGTGSIIDNYSKQEIKIPVTINVVAP